VVVKAKQRRPDDDDAQEDSCELRMRRLFQRRRTATCRRHTVANIPPPGGAVMTSSRLACVRDVIALSHGSESEGCHCCSRAQTPSNADDYKNRRCHYDAVRGLSDE